MTTTRDAARRDTADVATPAADEAVRGWYFYGITRAGPLGSLAAEAMPDGDAAVRLLEFSGLAAVVSPVALEDFGVTALRERLEDPATLEEMVRSHNEVIEAVHAQRAILPAKFGVVYSRDDEIVSALRSAHEVLLWQLEGLEGRDEFAVHLYADRDAIRARIATEDPDVARLREQCATARPGRAFFLEQQVRHALDAATDHALTTLASDTFDDLARRAVAGHLSAPAADPDPDGRVEILRASFLVSRGAVAEFEDAVRSVGERDAALRADFSGPWPPYSFAAYVAEAPQ